MGCIPTGCITTGEFPGAHGPVAGTSGLGSVAQGDAGCSEIGLWGRDDTRTSLRDMTDT